MIRKIELFYLNNKKIILIIISILIVIALLLYYFFAYEKHDDGKINIIHENVEKNDSEVIINETKEEIKENIEYIYVDIKGYVNKQGVYKFNKNKDNRVSDLIKEAGGLKKDADTSVINLAKKLYDEMIIIVYSKNEINDYLNTLKEINNKVDMCNEKNINNACIEKPLENNNDNKNSKININTANIEELMTLNGVGEEKAKSIVEYRNTNGLFKKIEDIMNITGIGESVFNKIKEDITIE